jgi:cytochrome c-type biogenesis protein CcmH/NrfG
MRASRVVVLLVAALLFYMGLIVSTGVFLVRQHGLVLPLYGAAVIVLPLVGLWLVWQEVRFGAATARLARQLPDDEIDAEIAALPRRPSGRVERVAADAVFARRKAQVEADPRDWRRWYRLAVAYDAAGDRRRARAAMRTAIERDGS